MTLLEKTHSHLTAHHGDFAEFAELMVQTHQGRFDEVFWSFVGRYCPAATLRVLDLGTGPGLLLNDLANKFQDAKITGVEAQEEMIKKAESLVNFTDANIELIRHDLANPPLPLSDGQYDLAIASMVLHELRVPTHLLDEMNRTLVSGGVGIIYDWVRQDLSTYFENQRPETDDQFCHFSEHCRYTPTDLQWLCEKSGFEVIEWMARKNGRHILMAVRKK